MKFEWKEWLIILLALVDPAVYFLNKGVWQGWAADGHQLIAIGFKRTNNCIGIRRNRGIGAKVITARGISLVVATDAICLHNGHNVV